MTPDSRWTPDGDAEGGDPASAADHGGHGGGVSDSDSADPTSDERARQRALGLACAQINRRERTVAEVRSHLERKDVAERHADEAVRTLIEQHLLDDERFAQLFVADKRELEQWGTARIRRGLSARGIDRELAERALAGGGGGGDASAPDGDRRDASARDGGDGELGRALELLRRRFPEPPRDRRDRDRALGVLLRKGYEQELALDALNAHQRGP